MVCVTVVSSVCYSGDGRRLAGSDSSGMVIVFDFEAGYEVFRTQRPGSVLCVSIARAGERLAICGQKNIQVFHVQTGVSVYERASSNERLRAVKISPGGDSIAAAIEGKVQVWGIDHGAHYHSFDKIHNATRSISIDHGGHIVALGCDDGEMLVFDLRLDTAVPQWAVTHASKVWCVAVSPDGAYVAAGDYADCVQVYASKSGAVLWHKASSWEGTGAPITWGLSFSGDSSMLAIGRWDTHAYLVETCTWNLAASVKRSDCIFSVSLDHLGKRMGVGGRDKKAQVFSINSILKRPTSETKRFGLADGKRQQRKKHELELIFSVQLDCFVQAVGLTPDGKILAVGCVDNAVYLYSVNTKLLLHAFAHGGAVHSMAFSPDAKYLAVGGEHKTVHIWRISEHSPPEHALALPRQGETTSVVFSRGSIGIVSSSRATIYGSGNNDYEVRARVLGPIVLPPTTHISLAFHSATLV